MIEDEVHIRPMAMADRPLVLNSWCMNQLYASRVPEDQHYDARIQIYRDASRIVRAAKVLVACDPADHSVIYGWVCASGRKCEYIYCKQLFRGRGIATLLAQKAGCDVDLRGIVSKNYARHKEELKKQP